MQALKITDVKECMNQLLIQDTFDHLLLSEAAVSSMITFTVDGHLNRGFYSDEEWSLFLERGIMCVPYGRIKQICYDMFKGKKTPESFRFIFLAPPTLTTQLIEKSQMQISVSDVEALSFNLIYKNGELTATGATSLRIFTLDKALDQAWDGWIRDFLTGKNISWDQN